MIQCFSFNVRISCQSIYDVIYDSPVVFFILFCKIIGLLTVQYEAHKHLSVKLFFIDNRSIVSIVILFVTKIIKTTSYIPSLLLIPI